MANADGDLFDVDLTPKLPKRARRIRKRPELCGLIDENAPKRVRRIRKRSELCVLTEKNELIKPCYCRFCKTSDEAVESQKVSMPQILKACIIKILHHCVMGCLQENDQLDASCKEVDTVKFVTSQISLPETLWIIINISSKLDKLYFTQDTLGELKTFILRIKKNSNPLSLIAKIEAQLPVSLKRFICQNVTEINYKKLLTVTL